MICKIIGLRGFPGLWILIFPYMYLGLYNFWKFDRASFSIVGCDDFIYLFFKLVGRIFCKIFKSCFVIENITDFFVVVSFV